MAAADGTLSEALFRRLWFPAEQPEQLEEAVAGVGAFYNLGQTPEEEAEPGAIPYGFREDAAPIFAAFWKHYGVDLSTKKLHWWHFRALLEGLFTHSFRQRVEYRLCDLGGRTAQERAEIIKYRSLYRIGGGDLSDHLRTLDQIIDTHGERKG